MNRLVAQNMEEVRVVESSNLDLLYSVDISLLSAVNEDGELLPFSDEQYAEEIQFQEVIMSSVISFVEQNPTGSPRNEGNPKREVGFTTTETGESSRSSCEACVEEKQEAKSITVETGESSKSSCNICVEEKQEAESITTARCLCEICVEEKQEEEIFQSKICSHVFCSDCISKHVATKIQDNIITVECPDLNCHGVLEPEFCRSIIPVTVFERWENALCESMVLGSQRFYYPFKDCSALLVDDGEEEIAQSECPSCHRLFCARCKVAWHSGVECEEFQRYGGDEGGRADLLAIEFAKSKKWQRCPKCDFYVEKTDGCLHITCRCGFEFCYGCGLTWSDAHHASCQPAN